MFQEFQGALGDAFGVQAIFLPEDAGRAVLHKDVGDAQALPRHHEAPVVQQFNHRAPEAPVEDVFLHGEHPAPPSRQIQDQVIIQWRIIKNLCGIDTGRYRGAIDRHKQQHEWYEKGSKHEAVTTELHEIIYRQVCLPLELSIECLTANSATRPITIVMTIKVDASFGEFLDKITILEIKSERISDPAKLENVNRELNLLREIWAAHPASKTDITDEMARLKAINEKLWEIEDDIRDKERDKTFDQQFIELARAVYFTNDDRADVKRELNLKLGSEVVEEKSYADYK